MADATAESLKEQGNEAFSAKKYQEALDLYSKAIQKDPQNHVFFSNRSATYGAMGQWKMAVDDAKECIRLDPTFVKGYYRLASAQLELEEYDPAMATIRQGLAVDNNNGQLSKLMRIIQQQKKVAQTKAQKVTTVPQQLDASTVQELQELQNQHRQTTMELGTVQATSNKAQKEHKIASITHQELQQSVADETPCYRAIGKMFARTTKQAMMSHLEEKMQVQSKLEADLHKKAEYLERQLESQQQNIQELVGNTGGTVAAAAT